jgi:putative flippase GtrA
MTRRLAAFITGGAIGFVLQVGALALLTMVVGWPYVPATAIAVELAVLHNFVWHDRWTFHDRHATTSETGFRLLKYQLTTGITSVGGNVVATIVAVHVFGLHVVPANIAAVAAMTAVNYFVADRWVFTRNAALPVAALIALSPTLASAQPAAQTIAAWNRYVAHAETHLYETVGNAGPEGASINVRGGTIHHWRGSIVVRQTTVDRVVAALMNPGTPPPQEDVLDSRVLARAGDSLHVYLKLARHAIVTVVYDTEHDVAFERISPMLARSRSISTRIEETGGSDRGFLWRLNSYWRYTQAGSDVRIDVESVSLSRAVPAVARPVVGRLAARVARESLSRTLDAVRRFLEHRRHDNSCACQTLTKSGRQYIGSRRIAMNAERVDHERETRAVARNNRLFRDHPKGAREDQVWVDEDRVRLASRRQRAVGLVCPIRKAFRCDTQVRRAARFQQPGTRRPEED